MVLGGVFISWGSVPFSNISLVTQRQTWSTPNKLRDYFWQYLHNIIKYFQDPHNSCKMLKNNNIAWQQTWLKWSRAALSMIYFQFCCSGSKTEFTTTGYKTDKTALAWFFFSTPLHRISSFYMRQTSHSTLVGESQKQSRNTQTTECVTADGTFVNHMFSLAWNPQPCFQRVNTDLVSVATLNFWWHHGFNFSSSPASKVGHMTN